MVLLKNILNYVHGLYKNYAYVVVAVAVIWLTPVGLMIITKQFETVELTNGIYIAKPYPFASSENLWLWKPDGTPLHEGPIEFVCFNDTHVATVVIGPSRSFIYSATDDVLVRSDDWDAYVSMKKGSGLSPPERSCDGHIKGWVGLRLLMQRPGMVREAREAQQ